MIIAKPVIIEKHIQSNYRERLWRDSYERNLEVGRNELSISVIVHHSEHYIKAPSPVRDTVYDREYFPEKDRTNKQIEARLKGLEEYQYDLIPNNIYFLRRSRALERSSSSYRGEKEIKVYGIVIYFYFWSEKQYENIEAIKSEPNGLSLYRLKEIVLPSAESPFTDWYKKKLVIDIEEVYHRVKETISGLFIDMNQYDFPYWELEFDKEYKEQL